MTNSNAAAIAASQAAMKAAGVWGIVYQPQTQTEFQDPVTGALSLTPKVGDTVSWYPGSQLVLPLVSTPSGVTTYFPLGGGLYLADGVVTDKSSPPGYVLVKLPDSFQGPNNYVLVPSSEITKPSGVFSIGDWIDIPYSSVMPNPGGGPSAPVQGPVAVNEPGGGTYTPESGIGQPYSPPSGTIPVVAGSSVSTDTGMSSQVPTDVLPTTTVAAVGVSPSVSTDAPSLSPDPTTSATSVPVSISGDQMTSIGGGGVSCASQFQDLSNANQALAAAQAALMAANASLNPAAMIRAGDSVMATQKAQAAATLAYQQCMSGGGGGGGSGTPSTGAGLAVVGIAGIALLALLGGGK